MILVIYTVIVLLIGTTAGFYARGLLTTVRIERLIGRRESIFLGYWVAYCTSSYPIRWEIESLVDGKRIGTIAVLDVTHIPSASYSEKDLKVRVAQLAQAIAAFPKVLDICYRL